SKSRARAANRPGRAGAGRCERRDGVAARDRAAATGTTPVTARRRRGAEGSWQSRIIPLRTRSDREGSFRTNVLGVMPRALLTDYVTRLPNILQAAATRAAECAQVVEQKAARATGVRKDHEDYIAALDVHEVRRGSSSSYTSMRGSSQPSRA